MALLTASLQGKFQELLTRVLPYPLVSSGKCFKQVNYRFCTRLGPFFVCLKINIKTIKFKMDFHISQL